VFNRGPGAKAVPPSLQNAPPPEHARQTQLCPKRRFAPNTDLPQTQIFHQSQICHQSQIWRRRRRKGKICVLAKSACPTEGEPSTHGPNRCREQICVPVKSARLPHRRARQICVSVTSACPPNLCARQICILDKSACSPDQRCRQMCAPATSELLDCRTSITLHLLQSYCTRGFQYSKQSDWRLLGGYNTQSKATGDSVKAAARF